jgi:archaellum component FlaC
MRRIFECSLVLSFLIAQPGWSDNTATDKNGINLDDDKFTKAEKRLDAQQANANDKQAEEKAQVINKVPGLNVASEDLKEKRLLSFSFNPLGWLLGPINNLEKQSVRLEQDIMKLSGPIAGLQPCLVDLGQRMTAIGKEMGSLKDPMVEVSKQVGEVRGQLRGVDRRMDKIETNISAVTQQLIPITAAIKMIYTKLPAIREQLNIVETHLEKIETPIALLPKPLIGIEQPIKNLESEVRALHSEMSGISEPLGEIQDPVGKMSQELNILHNDIAKLTHLLNLILTAIFAAALIIAVGTPLAAFALWRNKRRQITAMQAQEYSTEKLAKTRI